MVKDIISLVRPQQWLKNVFIFLPIFFSRKLGDGACLSSALIAFVIYCLVAGSIYCLNDICDRESDRLHPTKCRRPIASGAVSVGAGYGIMALLLVLAIALTFIYDSTVRHVLLINVGIYFILKRNNGFIPGVKPGKSTKDYLDTIMDRITLPGAFFLAVVAIMPAFARIAGVSMEFSQFFGGTSLLILVGVVLDTLQQVESHLLMRHYDGLLKSGRIKGRSGAVGAY